MPELLPRLRGNQLWVNLNRPLVRTECLLQRVHIRLWTNPNQVAAHHPKSGRPGKDTNSLVGKSDDFHRAVGAHRPTISQRRNVIVLRFATRMRPARREATRAIEWVCRLGGHLSRGCFRESRNNEGRNWIRLRLRNGFGDALIELRPINGVRAFRTIILRPLLATGGTGEYSHPGNSYGCFRHLGNHRFGDV